MLLTSNWIPKEVNLFVQRRSKSWQKVVPLSPHAPILTTLFFPHLEYHEIRLKPAYSL